MYGGRCMSTAPTEFAAADSTRPRPRAYAPPRDAGPWRRHDPGSTRDEALDGSAGIPSSRCESERGPEVIHFE